MAKLSKAGGGGASLTPQQLGGLSWDDPAVLDAHKLSAPPLQLNDGDVLVVRDRHHPAPTPVVRSPTPEVRRPRAATFIDEVSFFPRSRSGVTIREPMARHGGGGVTIREPTLGE